MYLGTTTRAKAVALNPSGNHTAAVLQMGAPQAVTVFNTQTGAVLQTFSVPYTTTAGKASTDSDGSQQGITYTPDGKYLLFSQDGSYGPTSYVSIATVNPSSGLLSNYAQVKVPIDVDSTGKIDQRYLRSVQAVSESTEGQPLQEQQAASAFPAAIPTQFSRMTPSPPIPKASQSLPMARPPMPS